MAGGCQAISKRNAKLLVKDDPEKRLVECRARESRDSSVHTVLSECDRRGSVPSAAGQGGLATDGASELSTAVLVETRSESPHRLTSALCHTGSDVGTKLDMFTTIIPASSYPFLAKDSDLDTAAPSAGHPENFGVVVPGVYRSSYPQAQDYTFIRDLKLRTIVTLVDKDFPDSYRSFIAENGIRHHVFSMKGTKKEDIPMKTMRDILRLVLNHQNHPLLIHCNHGKHRTGCVVAVVRKVTGWKLPRIVDEYREFAGAKARDCDVKYITLFDLSSLSNLFAERSAMQVRTRIFIRITVFTFFVLVIWLFSGINLPRAHPLYSQAYPSRTG